MTARARWGWEMGRGSRFGVGDVLVQVENEDGETLLQVQVPPGAYAPQVAEAMCRRYNAGGRERERMLREAGL